MSSLNKILLIGHVENTPEVRVSTSGDPVANFVLAVERPHYTQGMPSQTDHLNIVGWRQTATKAEQLKQGQLIMVEGRIHTRSYETQEGVRKYVTEIDARDISALDGTQLQVAENVAFSKPEAKQPTPVSEPVAEPVIEEKKAQDNTSFDFNESEPSISEGLPEAFSEEVAEDIPF